MASPAKSSSSSIPCRTIPNAKKTELCDPRRRSFSGNPFTRPTVITNPKAFNPNTPANSPSDFPRRHSIGRESVASLRDSDKENSKDQNPKPARVRSPASSKGTKNFMSPTISAASKINASPRKKILVERNEPVRSSVSFSDVKSLIIEDNESTPETALKQKKVSFSDVQSVIMEDESTPEIGSKQKKFSFSDVKSIIMEDNESTPEISLNQKKVSLADVKGEAMEDNQSTAQIGLKQKNNEVPHDSQSSNHEHEEPLTSNPDFDSKKFKNDSDSLLETVTEEKDSVLVDPSFKISPRVSISPSCPIVAPLDADPLMLPYDPKTNYLSPRPQFLRYRPNPRIELYREREGKHLEEHFASECYSDTDVTEETHSEGSQRESDEEEELQVSEPNPIASNMVEEKFEARRMFKPRSYTRSKFIALLLVLAFAYFSVLVANSPAFNPGMEELSLSNFQVPPYVTEFAKANFHRFMQNLSHWWASFFSYVSNIISSLREVHKPGPFQYANLSHLLEDHMIERQLMFDHSVMGPVKERNAGNELFDNKYYQEIQADEAVDEDEGQEDQDNGYGNLELVSEEAPEEVQQWIEAEMIEPDRSEAEESKGVELTAQIERQLMFDHCVMEPVKERNAGNELTAQIERQLMFDHSVMEPVKERNAGNELFDNKYYQEIQADEAVDEDEEQEDQDNGYGNLELVSEEAPEEVQQWIEAEMIEPDRSEAEESIGVELTAQIGSEQQSNVDLKHPPSIIPQVTEIQHDMSRTEKPEGDDYNIAETVFPKEKSDNLKIEDSTDNSQSYEVGDCTINGPEDQILSKNVMGFIILLVCLFAASTFIHTKRGKPFMPNAAVSVEPPLLAEKSEYRPVSVCSKGTIHEMPYSVNMANESFPSAMSSCPRTSSSYSKNELKESNEYQSQERKPRKSYRRESLASSDYSMGSASYGSFTTYEKISSKHGGEEEEIVTPVRRSNRIRKQITSP